MAQFQAKETTDIPQDVYNGIMGELKKDKFIKLDELSYKTVREILKKLKYNKYYEHIPHIINIINGKPAPVLTRCMKTTTYDVEENTNTFCKYCPTDDANFLSYSMFYINFVNY